MQTQTTTPIMASRRAVRAKALVVIAAIALVLSTLLGAAGADAGPRQGDGNRVIIITGSSR